MQERAQKEENAPAGYLTSLHNSMLLYAKRAECIKQGWCDEDAHEQFQTTGSSYVRMPRGKKQGRGFGGLVRMQATPNAANWADAGGSESESGSGLYRSGL